MLMDLQTTRFTKAKITYSRRPLKMEGMKKKSCWKMEEALMRTDF